MVCAADWCPHRGAVDSQHDGPCFPSHRHVGPGLLNAVGVDASVFPPVMDNRDVVAELRKELAAKIGARNQWPFVLVASHDTASAVAAILLAPELPSCPRAHGRSWASSWMLQ